MLIQASQPADYMASKWHFNTFCPPPEARLETDRKAAEARLEADRKAAETKLEADRKMSDARLKADFKEFEARWRWTFGTFIALLGLMIAAFGFYMNYMMSRAINGATPQNAAEIHGTANEPAAIPDETDERQD